MLPFKNAHKSGKRRAPKPPKEKYPKVPFRPNMIQRWAILEFLIAFMSFNNAFMFFSTEGMGNVIPWILTLVGTLALIAGIFFVRQEWRAEAKRKARGRLDEGELCYECAQTIIGLAANTLPKGLALVRIMEPSTRVVSFADLDGSPDFLDGIDLTKVADKDS